MGIFADMGKIVTYNKMLACIQFNCDELWFYLTNFSFTDVM
jgi:hypothetical protein